jgi:ADP-dependent NAD(P)H-hydrate dehydratase / NAD(P)H-hydrate epimerase
MRIVQPAQMAEIDRRAQEDYFIPGAVLMENAGIKSLQRFLDLYPEGAKARLLFIAGSGNNGGDALVMARQAYLQLPEAEVKVLTARKKSNELCGVHSRSVAALGIPHMVWEESEKEAESCIADAQVIFDGISGTGLKGALREPLDRLVRAIEDSAKGALIVAIDVPSGVGEGYTLEKPALRADLTLTMGLPKTVLYGLNSRPLCGRIEVVSLGFPPSLLEDPPESGELAGSFAARSRAGQDYKNSRGHAAVFAGAIGTTGAAALAAHAAARAGAGLVSLYCDEPLYPLYAGAAEGVMVRPHKGPDTLSGEFSRRHGSLVAGPGWGDGRKELLQRLLQTGLPGVADADALCAAVELTEGKMARRDSAFPGDFWDRRWVLTPHPGEFSFLSDIAKEELFADPIPAVREASKRLNAVVLLKAHVAYIAEPDGAFAVVDGMNPAMGTGGSGDVLAGIVGGLLSGAMDPYDAAVTAASVHQAAGRRAASKIGWFAAEDLLPQISKLLWTGRCGGGDGER